MYACCCPTCAIASAKSNFDGRYVDFILSEYKTIIDGKFYVSSWIFNCFCFGTSPMFVRNYIRMGYNIEGRVGRDCCVSICCGCCSINQMLNETETRGPKITSITSTQQSDWVAPVRDFSILGDPCGKNILFEKIPILILFRLSMCIYLGCRRECCYLFSIDRTTNLVRFNYDNKVQHI